LFFYTGKRPLVSARIDQLTSTNVQVIRGRPNLPVVIRNIIYGIESEVGCPQQYIEDQRDTVTRALLGTLQGLDSRGSISNAEKLVILAQTATDYGFQLSNALYDVGGLFDQPRDTIQEELSVTDRIDETEVTYAKRDSPTNSQADSETSWDEEKALEKLLSLAGGRTDRGGLYISPSTVGGARTSTMSSRYSNAARISTALKISTAGRISTLGRISNSGRISNTGSVGGAGGDNSLRNRRQHSRRLRRQTAMPNMVVPGTPKQGGGLRASTVGGLRGSTLGGFRGSTLGAGPRPSALNFGRGMDLSGHSEHSATAYGMDGSGHSMRETSHRMDHSAKSRDTMLEEAMEIGFKPWEEGDDPEHADYFVKNLDEKLLATWGLLYCGGSKIIEEQLKLAAAEYGIELHAESFSW